MNLMSHRKRFFSEGLLFLVGIGLPALVIRAIRNRWVWAPQEVFEFFDRQLFVLLEHFVAGIGCAWGISCLLIGLTLYEGRGDISDRKVAAISMLQRFFESTRYDATVILGAAAGYAYHIFFHESRQTMTSGYWGAPKAQVQTAQVAVGLAGVLGFLILAWALYRRPTLVAGERPIADELPHDDGNV